MFQNTYCDKVVYIDLSEIIIIALFWRQQVRYITSNFFFYRGLPYEIVIIPSRVCADFSSSTTTELLYLDYIPDIIVLLEVLDVNI